MKSWSKNVVFFVCLLFLFFIVGCGSSGKSLEVINESDFKDILEDMDYSVSVIGSDDSMSIWMEGADPFLVASAADDSGHILFFSEYGAQKDLAVDDFNNITDSIDKAIEDKAFDGKYTKTSGENYRKCVIKGEFEKSYVYFPVAAYQVYLQVDNTLIALMATEGSTSDVREIDKILEELGY